jgi:hypothetical protein
MTYVNVPINRRDLKEKISKSQRVGHIALNWEHHVGYKTISGERGSISQESLNQWND